MTTRNHDELEFIAVAYSVVFLIFQPIANKMIGEEVGRISDFWFVSIAQALGGIIFIVCVCDGCSSESGPIVFAEGGVCGMSGDGFTARHIAKLRTAAIEINLTIVDCHVYIACNLCFRRRSTTKETPNQGMVYFGCHINISITTRSLLRFLHVSAEELVDM